MDSGTEQEETATVRERGQKFVREREVKSNRSAIQH
jgi:hypothetical protein